MPVEVRGQILKVGMVREGDPDPSIPQEFVENAIAGLVDAFVRPELSRRGSTGEPTDVGQALICLPPVGPPVVRLGDEVEFVAQAGAGSRLVDPAETFVGQITDMWPVDIDPDVAWSGWTTADGGRVFVCDFRRNRQRVRPLITRAWEFHRAAELAVAGGLVAPATEHLTTAAELAVMVLMFLDGVPNDRNHRRRVDWLELGARYSDVPAVYAAAFRALVGERNAARYVEDGGRVSEDAVADRLGVVQSLIRYAEERAGVSEMPDSS